MFFRRAPKSAARPAAPAGFRPGVERLDDRITPSAGGLLDAPFFGAGQFNFAPSSSSTTTTPQVATRFAVQVRPSYAGTDAAVTVTAVDANGRAVRDYAGTVALTSSDTAATLPASYTFTAADRGRHTFAVKFGAAGSPTVTATDAATSAVTGTATARVVAAPVATQLGLRVERDAYSGAVTRVLVAALDANGRVVPTYTGTVALTSTDAGATLPANATFTAADRGVKVLTFTPSTTGTQTLTATDTATSTVVGSASVAVTAAPVATRFALVTGRAIGVGNATSVYLVAVDASGRIAPTYSGTVSLTSSDAAATLPTGVTFTAADRGVKLVSVTLATAGSQTLTAVDAANASLTGTATVAVRTAADLLAGIGGGRRGPRG